ncbi:MAG TPA: LysM peptidoglycan-binding domain-containing protein [Candidatus Paceibacterota bacterium]|nr:LysM peptidoglycan-binding domain-containing protein [Verrucomicrobiota bacterium]HSA12872.1 LysM peptidoglycan-binding domain-containing protein [Candidatus Paceibacterota bacterium]
MTFPVGLSQVGLYLLAVLVLSGCLPSAPKDEEKEPHFQAGRSRVNTMDFKGAIESFEKALEVNPKSASAHFELGWLYDQKESDPAAAIFHYERYLKLYPNSPKEQMVTNHIMACKQQLAQAVSLAPGLDKRQRDLEQLAEENRRLREEVDKLRAEATRLQILTNRSGAALTVVRATQATGAQPGSPGIASSGGTSAARPAAAVTAPSRTHTVKAGETLSLISRRYGVKVEALMLANPKVNPRRIQVGQRLIIPPP